MERRSRTSPWLRWWRPPPVWCAEPESEVGLVDEGIRRVESGIRELRERLGRGR